MRITRRSVLVGAVAAAQPAMAVCHAPASSYATRSQQFVDLFGSLTADQQEAILRLMRWMARN